MTSERRTRRWLAFYASVLSLSFGALTMAGAIAPAGGALGAAACWALSAVLWPGGDDGER
jgi:hypothetical protein